MADGDGIPVLKLGDDDLILLVTDGHFTVNKLGTHKRYAKYKERERFNHIPMNGCEVAENCLYCPLEECKEKVEDDKRQKGRVG